MLHRVGSGDETGDLMRAGVATTKALSERIVVITIGVVITMFVGRALGRQETPVAPAACVVAPMISSPVASSPVAFASPTARGASVASIAVTAAIANLIACWNDADWQTSSLQVTENYLVETYGSPDRETFIALQERFAGSGFTTEASLISLETVRDVGTGFATADVLWQEGDAVKSERWYLAHVEGRWLVDQIRPLPPELSGDVVGIEFVVDDLGVHLSRDRIVNPGTVVIRIRNLTDRAMSISLIRLATLAEVRERLTGGSVAGSDQVLRGQVTIANGESQDLVVADPREGEYTIVVGMTIPFGPDALLDGFSAPLSITSP